MDRKNVTANNLPFQSINDTARSTGLSRYFLRKMLAQGKLPGVYVGVKFMVNVDALLKQYASGE